MWLALQEYVSWIRLNKKRQPYPFYDWISWRFYFSLWFTVSAWRVFLRNIFKFFGYSELFDIWCLIFSENKMEWIFILCSYCMVLYSHSKYNAHISEQGNVYAGTVWITYLRYCGYAAGYTVFKSIIFQ